MTDLDQRSLEYASEVSNLRDKLQNIVVSGRSKDGAVSVQYWGTGLVSQLKVKEDQTDLNAVLSGIQQAINDGNERLCQEAAAEQQAFDEVWQSMFASLAQKEALQPYFPSIKRTLQGERYEQAVQRRMRQYLGPLAGPGAAAAGEPPAATAADAGEEKAEAAPPAPKEPREPKAEAQAPPSADGASSTPSCADGPPLAA
eukprot:EG_transcript_25253